MRTSAPARRADDTLPTCRLGAAGCATARGGGREGAGGRGEGGEGSMSVSVCLSVGLPLLCAFSKLG